jgi:hypothetical protein
MANQTIADDPEIATEDAAEVLDELGEQDFIIVVANLIKRRALIGNIADTKKDQQAIIKAISKKLKLT